MRLPWREYFGFLVRYLRPQARWVALLAALVLVTIGLRLANPQILRQFIDVATSGGPRSELIRGALLFFGIAVLAQLLSVAATYVGETVAWTATNALRLDLLRHALHLDPTFHKDHSPGQLIERIDGDVATLSNFLSRFTIDVVGNAILIAGIVALLFREDWRIGLPILAFVVLTVWILGRIRKVAVPHWTAYRKQMAEFFGFVGERLSGTEDVRANGGVPYVMRRFFDLVRKLYPVRLRSGIAGYGMWMANVALFTFGQAIAFGVGATLWRASIITLGTVYLVFYYTDLLHGPISAMREQITDLQRAEAGLRRIRAMLGTPSKLQDDGRELLPSGALPVVLDRVTFAYEPSQTQDGPPAGGDPVVALRDVTLDVPAGTTLGLLGRTGSGKSTLARLVARLYDCQEGTVKVGECNVRDVGLDHLRSRVRLVSQEVQVFRASVRENVRLFDPSISDEAILAALGELGLREWVLALPSGLDAVVGTGEAGLSAGQGQLLALARTFLADPAVIILDEASSRLDPATEALLEHAVDRLLAGRTAIVIAHRLSTVRRADSVAILEAGEVLERGKREVLAGDPTSHLSRLLRTGMEEVLV
ncbi:MAG: ABC transporter ATP-binding protein [Candidatus Bipolaricaulota bacterium]|nr:ABC transporter ATP-binding protein [Candidatus Bipolaricaulota bacterium]